MYIFSLFVGMDLVGTEVAGRWLIDSLSGRWQVDLNAHITYWNTRSHPSEERQTPDRQDGSIDYSPNFMVSKNKENYIL